ncbi:MAG: holo-ACP synthase [Emcibacteraceae bacterium]|nr:holo-ACP synthase [Emcibacteraceae bacterium]
MKIIGLGNDLTDIRRIEKSINRFDDRFVKRVFTDKEIKYCNSKGNKAANFAKRFAAKEAFSKALGTGFSEGVYWKDMEVINDALGKPIMHLSGGALKRLEGLTPVGLEAQIDLSLTDEYPHAQAIVILTAVKS